ncbi:MAG: hypothetical protein HOA95_10735, partial [Planctomycetes bacterium]|nr:hypothetical protein [Planctomycetota bacterium]
MKLLPASLTALMLALLMGCVTVLLDSARNSTPPIADSTDGTTGTDVTTVDPTTVDPTTVDPTTVDPTTVAVVRIVAPTEELAPFIDEALD